MTRILDMTPPICTLRLEIQVPTITGIVLESVGELFTDSSDGACVS
jgi:hypothetical protein